MKPQQWNILRPLVVEATLSLFASCGIALDPIGEPAEPLLLGDGMAAIIGFAGSDARGSVALGVERGDLMRLYAHSLGEEPADMDLRDWARELSNQLLGRVKNRVLDLGLCFQLSIPVCLVGLHLKCLLGPRDNTRTLLFGSPDGAQINVLFSMELAAGFTLEAAGRSAPAVPVSEGGMLLFD